LQRPHIDVKIFYTPPGAQRLSERAILIANGSLKNLAAVSANRFFAWITCNLLCRFIEKGHPKPIVYRKDTIGNARHDEIDQPVS
jgi:hypothetical protein